MDNLLKELTKLMYRIGVFTEYIATNEIKNVQTKDDLSPVTLADFGAQILVSHWLCENFAGEPLIAEETLKSLPENNRNNFIERLKEVLSIFLPEITDKKIVDYINLNSSSTSEKSYWVLDPLDGTKGFLRGDQYAISLGHVDDGVVDLGILACPRLNLSHLFDEQENQQKGCVFVAKKGEGAWVQISEISKDYIPIHVSECREPTTAKLLRSYESRHTDIEKTNLFIEKLGIKEFVLMDSQAKYGLLACGMGEIILRFPPKDNPGYREKIWDHAGGVVILQEAGGRVTDIFGKSFIYDGNSLLNNSVGVFASNGYLHEIGLRYLREIWEVEREK